MNQQEEEKNRGDSTAVSRINGLFAGFDTASFKFFACFFLVFLFVVFSGCFKKSDTSGSFLDKASDLVNASGVNADAPTILTGRTLDALSSLGLNGVQVKSDGGLQVQSRSDGLKDGVYAISGVPLGTYALTFSHSKYETSQKTIQVAEAQRGTTIDLGDMILYPVGSPVAGEIRGFVFSSNGGAGLDGALISLENGVTQVAANSGQGSGGYFFPNAPVGTYNLTVSATAHVSQTHQITLSRLESKKLDFVLLPVNTTTGQTVETTGNITGRVVDAETLLGLDGVKVSTEGGKITYTANNGVRAGVFSFEKVPSGSYKLFLEYPGYLTGVQSVDVVAASTAWQDLSDLVLHSSPIPMTSLKGIVYQEGTEYGVDDVFITLEGGASTISANNGINAGSYFFDGTAPVGIYTATLRRSGFITLSTSALTVLQGVINTRDFRMVRSQSLYNRGTIVGKVVDISRDVAAAPRTRVKIVATPEPGAIFGATLETMTVYSPTNPDIDGTFTMLNAEPGTYTITASLAGFDDASVSGIKVSAGDVTDGIEIQITGMLGSISGYIYQDMDLNGIFTSSLDFPIPGATVEISGAGISTKSRVNGSYTLDQVNLGEGYIVLAGASVEERGRYLQNYVDGINVTSTLPHLTGINIRLKPASTLAGKGHVDGYVYEKSGLPLAGATVEIDPGGANYRAVLSESDGFFFMADINAGTYVVRAGKANYSYGAQIVEIPPDNTSVSLASHFVLAPYEGSILGIVFNDVNADMIYDPATDKPISGATISVTYGNPPQLVTAESAMNGYYVLNEIPYGDRVITAVHNSYGKSVISVALQTGTFLGANLAMKAEIGGVTGEVYLDLPGGTQGVMDGADPYVKGAVVTLYSDTELTFTTGSDGAFHFNDVPVGDRILKVEKAGYAGNSLYVAIIPNGAAPPPPVSIGISSMTAALAGRVVSKTTGEALGGITVEVQGIPGSATQSAQGSGYFLLGGLYPEAGGTYYVINAYSGTYEASQSGPHVLVPGQTLSSLQIELSRRRGSISGTVLESGTSTPLQGAAVSVVGTSITAQTDSSGRFQLTGVDIGQVRIALTATGYLSITSAPIEVQANTSTQADQTLTRALGGIQGRVTIYGTGSPTPGATVEILGSVTTTTNTLGFYSFSSVATGAHSLIAYALSHEASVKSNVTVIAGTTVKNVDFALTPSYGSVTGRCEDPLAYPSALEDILIRVDGTTLNTLTDADGKYSINNVPAGTRVFRAFGEGYPNVVSAPSIVPAGGVLVLDFTLVPSVGTITGTLRDKSSSEPVSGATVELPGLALSAVTDSAGLFALANVPAGNDYALNMRATGYQTASLKNLDLPLNGNLSTGTTDLIRKVGSVSGRVLDSFNNIPVADAAVKMEVVEGLQELTDQQGNYSITGVHVLLDGATVTVTATGYARASASGVRIIESIDSRIDFQLTPVYGSIAGQVVDSASNLGIDGAQIRIRGTFLSSTSDSRGLFDFTRVPVSTGLTLEVDSLDYDTVSLGSVAVTSGQVTAVVVPMTPKFALVTGRVLDDVTGQPVDDVIVSLAGMNRSMTTGVDGVFNFGRVPVTALGVTLEGVKAEFQLGRSKTGPLIAGQYATADVRLTSLFGIIVGRVADFQNGNGIQSATVRVQGLSLITTTDSKGSYSLSSVLVGSGLTVEALASGYSIGRNSGITVTPSATIIVDFELKSTTGTLAGMIMNSGTGAGITGVGVTISGSVRGGYSDASGQYEISLVPATAGTTVELVADGYLSRRIGGIAIDAGGTTTLNVYMTPTFGYLAGVVRNAMDDQPIQGAIATVTSTVKSATSSSSGFFVFDRIAAGAAMTLEVQATNFEPTSRPGITVGPGQTVSLSFSLTPSSGSIAGTIISSVRGDALEDVTVSLPNYSLVQSTDSKGFFEITGLKAATGVTVNFSLPGYNDVTRPGLEVEKGKTTTLEITMVPVHGLLAGLCTDSISGVGLTGVVVVAVGSGQEAVTSGTGGYYQFATLPSNPVGYTIEASLSGYFNSRSNTGAIVAGSTSSLNMGLTPNRGAITGTITSMVSGLGLEDVIVNISASGASTATSSTGGYYRITNIPPSGTGYTVEASLAGYSNVSIPTGVILPGISSSLNFTMTPSTGAISGTVVDAVTGIGVTGVLVTIPGAAIQPMSTISGGYFEITGVPPSGSGVTVEVSIVGYMNGSAKTGPLDPGQVVTLDFTLTRTTGSIAGSVVDWATDLPLANVSITLPGSGLAEVKSGAGGVYEITGVVASVTGVTIGASITGYSRADIHVSPINPGETAFVNFVLTRTTGQITGNVVDAVSGFGLSGALLTIPGSSVSSVNSGEGGQYLLTDVPVSPTGVTVDISLAGYFANSVKSDPVEGGKAAILLVSMQPNSGMLTGTVSDGTSGRPIYQALVEVTGGAGLRATTDLAGYYEITGVKVNISGVTIEVSKPGYSGRLVQTLAINSGALVIQDVDLTPTSGTLVGLVEDSVTLQPIAGALVMIPGTTLSTSTSVGGSYVLTNIPNSPAGFTVEAYYSGYQSSKSGVSSLSGGQSATVDLFLTPSTGAIYGLITDSIDDKALSGAEVALPALDLRFTTGAAGYYRLDNVNISSTGYTLEVFRTGYAPTSLASGPIVPGTALEHRIALTPIYGMVVGQIIDSVTLFGLQGVSVYIEGSTRAPATTGVGGNYTMTDVAVSAIGYTLEARVAGYGTMKSATGPILAGDYVKVNFAMEPLSGVITGTILDSVSGLGISNVRLTVPGYTSLAALSGLGGLYEMTNVPSTLTGVTVIATATGYKTTSVKSGAVTGGLATTMDFSMEQVYGTIVGRVTDSFSSLGLSGVEVYIPGVDAGTATTDGTGFYQLTSVPASTLGMTLEASLAGYRKGSGRLTALAGGEVGSLDIAITPVYGSISGTIQDSVTGLGVSGVVLSVVAGETPPVTTNSSGYYFIQSIPASTAGITLEANHTRYTTRRVGSGAISAGTNTVMSFGIDPVYGIITGTVKDNVSGLGLTGASVRISGLNILDTTTTGGYYELNDVPQTSTGLTLEALMEGYSSAKVFLSSLSGGSVAALDIPMTSLYGYLTGRVYDSVSSSSILGARVLVPGIGQEVTTSNGGYYELFNVPVNPLGVTVQAFMDNYLVFKLKTGAVDPGMESVCDIAMVPLTGVIMGVISDYGTGQGVNGAQVRLQGSVFSTTTDSTGAYVFSQVAASALGYTVEATAQNYFNSVKVAGVLTGGGFITVAMDLTPSTGALTGVLTDLVTGAPVAGANVSITGKEFTVTSSSSGQYYLTDVPAGVAVTLEVMADKYVPTLKAAGTVEGGRTGALDVVLTPAYGTVAGQIIESVQGFPVADAMVRLPKYGLTAMTGSDGVYVISDVPINMTLGTVEAMMSDYAAVRSLALAADTIVPPDMDKELDFVMTRLWGAVAGTVVDGSSGTPLADVMVMLGNNSVYQATFSDSQGRYKFTQVPVVTGLELTASRGFQWQMDENQTISLDIQRGITHEVDVELYANFAANFRVFGTIFIRDAGGLLRPAPKWKISAYGPGTSTYTDNDGNFMLFVEQGSLGTSGVLWHVWVYASTREGTPEEYATGEFFWFTGTDECNINRWWQPTRRLGLVIHEDEL